MKTSILLSLKQEKKKDHEEYYCLITIRKINKRIFL